MNREAKRIGMASTYFCNPHGLSTKQQYSCAADVLILSQHAFNNELISDILSHSTYACEVFHSPKYKTMAKRRGFKKHKAIWYTSNQILGDDNIFQHCWKNECKGTLPPQAPTNTNVDLVCELGKTGITNQAGGCFASIFRSKLFGTSFFVAVLGSNDKMGGRSWL
jgi:D-alanyl-D-alanine carboxypeptidase